MTLSTIGVLCQLGATVRLRDELESWLPGFLAEYDKEAGEVADEQGTGAESEQEDTAVEV